MDRRPEPVLRADVRSTDPDPLFPDRTHCGNAPPGANSHQIGPFANGDLATVHKAGHGQEHEGGAESEEEAAFADIEVCTVTIADESGRELGAYQLAKEFGDFNVVQLGSVMHGDNGWEYAPVGRGFTGSINDVLSHFS